MLGSPLHALTVAVHMLPDKPVIALFTFLCGILSDETHSLIILNHQTQTRKHRSFGLARFLHLKFYSNFKGGYLLKYHEETGPSEKLITRITALFF